MKKLSLNSEKIQNSNSGMTSAGRKKGSTNRLNQNAKDALFDVLNPSLKDLNKRLNSLEPNERVMVLKGFAKMLAVGDDEVAQKTRKLIYEGLEEHFKKLKFYFPHVPQEKKITELRQFLSLLPIQNIEEVVESMKNQNIRF
ncbi:hypothetical protein NBRC110019_18110 [Neptunitalea chrysea]|uniref:Uncharacterized protein n=1 Tax=Neptunitalea chrysea TaxID=1647581 RepID=A0A9W6B4U3_9FLAO|nr:hypothetical protein [Neptunitalea chrysea]GLB52771.1 hypothetical protein NBRC110019_18110 [Neptunitalea chrysea]